jgi:DNA-binding transcriptional MerR regulator
MVEKIYYSMGEVAEMLCVSPSLVRFWEKRFECIAPHKNKKGNRLFSPADVRNLKTIYHLVKEKGMTLAGAEKQLKARRGEIERDMEIAERLGVIRTLLMEVRNELGGGGVIVDNTVAPEVAVAAPEKVTAVESEKVVPDPDPEPRPEPAPTAEPNYVEQTLF